MNPTIILVHCDRMKDNDEVFKGIVERLYSSYKSGMQVNYSMAKRRIDISDCVTFLFRGGDAKHHIVGMRYDLYYTDSFKADKYLEFHCINGKKGEIRDIYEFVDRIMDGYSERGDQYWDSDAKSE